MAREVVAAAHHGLDRAGAGIEHRHRRVGISLLGEHAGDGPLGLSLESQVDRGLDAEPALEQQVVALVASLSELGVVQEPSLDVVDEVGSRVPVLLVRRIELEALGHRGVPGGRVDHVELVHALEDLIPALAGNLREQHRVVVRGRADQSGQRGAAVEIQLPGGSRSFARMEKYVLAAAWIP